MKRESNRHLQRLKKRVTEINQNIQKMKARADHPTRRSSAQIKKKVGLRANSGTTIRRLRISARTINKRIHSISQAGVITREFLKEVVGI